MVTDGNCANFKFQNKIKIKVWLKLKSGTKIDIETGTESNSCLEQQTEWQVPITVPSKFEFWTSQNEHVHGQ